MSPPTVGGRRPSSVARPPRIEGVLVIRRHALPALVALSLTSASLGVAVASAGQAAGAAGGQHTKADARSVPYDKSPKIRRAKKSDLAPLGAAALAAEPG